MKLPETGASRSQLHVMVMAIHALCWLLFLSLPGIFNTHRADGGFPGLMHELSETSRWTNAALLIVAFYVNYLYAIPRLYFGRRYVAFALSTAGFFLAFFLVNFFLQPVPATGGSGLSHIGNSFNLFMFLTVYLVSFVLCLTRRWHQLAEERWSRKMAVVTERLSPHILFNTLNSIYALSLAKPDAVPAAIVRLSQTLRYTVHEGENRALLEKEVEFLRNYIELEKLRLPPDVEFILNVDSALPQASVPRLLLVPLVDAAFRSALLCDGGSKMHVHIYGAENEFSMHIEGTSAGTRDVLERFDAAHLRRQLDLHYPANYTLDLTDNGHIFVVTLRIRLS